MHIAYTGPLPQPEKILLDLDTAPCTLRANACSVVLYINFPSLATASIRIRLQPLAAGGHLLGGRLCLAFSLIALSAEEQSISRNQAY